MRVWIGYQPQASGFNFDNESPKFLGGSGRAWQKVGVEKSESRSSHGGHVACHKGALLPRLVISTSTSSDDNRYSRPFKMTIYLSLVNDSPFPASPSFLVPSQDPNEQLSKVVKAIMKARRIVVVCGKLYNQIEWDKVIEHRDRCWNLCTSWHS